MIKRYYWIYKITSPSGRVYIGQTCNFKNRMSCYRRLACKEQRLLYNTILKYGFDNLNIEILKEGDYFKYQADIFEMMLIDHYKSNYNLFPKNKGLNLTIGGDGVIGVKVTEETKQKIRNSRLGSKMPDKTRLAIYNANKGSKRPFKKMNLSEEQRLIKRNRMIGNKLMLNRKLSKDTIDKMILSRSWYKPNQEVKNKISDKNSISILQYSLKDEFIREWKSAREVYNILGWSYKNIQSVCSGKRKTANGFIWKYNLKKDNDKTTNRDI